MPPSVIFGDVRGLNLDELQATLKKYGITRLDSAAIYENTDSERRLGDARMGQNFTIDTKIYTIPPCYGDLTPEKIDASSKASLERLKLDKVNVLYVHGPDYQTPVEQQAKGFDEIYRKGRCSEVGLSNCMPEMVQEWLRIAKEKGYVKPTWYEGHYNLVVRSYEDILFPLLRSEGMHFAAYSPFAGGFLHGNLTPEKKAGQRFTTHAGRAAYLRHYDRPALHDAFKKLQNVSEATGLGTDELSLRWLVFHSKLQGGDVVILGASKIRHIETACANVQKGPLQEDVAAKLTALWTDELRQTAKSVVDYSPRPSKASI